MLARENQDRLIACPTCGERLKGKNLIQHHDRLHAFARSAVAFSRVEGLDLAAATNWIFVQVLTAAAAGVCLAYDQKALGITFCVASGVAATMACVGWGWEKVSRASLVNQGGRLTLQRSLWVPATFLLPVRSVEIGAMKRSRTGINPDARDSERIIASGSYLRIQFASGRLLLHLPSVGEGVQRARWSPASYRAGKQRHCSKSALSLSREDADVVQRWLLEQGALVPRGVEAPTR